MNSIKWLKNTTLPSDFVIKEYLDRPFVKMYHGASKKERKDVRRGCPLYIAMLRNGWTDMGEVQS
jgi:hypothetical protein